MCTNAAGNEERYREKELINCVSVKGWKLQTDSKVTDLIAIRERMRHKAENTH